MSLLSELLPSGGGAGGVVEAVASGALSNGDTVIVNSDGTVSVVDANATTFSQTTGSQTVFGPYSGTYYHSVAYDTVNNKVVIAFNDGSYAYGRAVVGTISGTSITFGTPVVFASAATYDISATYDVNAQKVVIAYRDNGNSNRGTAIVGTVSGDSISFGSETTFSSSAVYHIAATYDANAQKVVIAYRYQVNYAGIATVGTVSGDSISFVDSSTFESGNTSYVSATYDSNTQQVIIAYRDESNSNYGTAVTGVVEGNSINFATPVVFSSTQSNLISATYDSSSECVVITFQDGNTSDYGAVTKGTVSGTSLTFGSSSYFATSSVGETAVVYDANANKSVIVYKDTGDSGKLKARALDLSGGTYSYSSSAVTLDSSTIEYCAVGYDSDEHRVVVAYQDQGNSYYGTALVWRNAYSETNLTSDNFIGISDADYANGATATIQVAGAVDDAQTGLTAGQAYYVQTDGTLSTTAGSPEVFAGTAISSTKIIVGG